MLAAEDADKRLELRRASEASEASEGKKKKIGGASARHDTTQATKLSNRRPRCGKMARLNGLCYGVIRRPSRVSKSNVDQG